MRENLRILSTSLTEFGIVLVAFLTPLLYSGATLDLFEFPKQLFLYTAVLVLLAAWLTRMYLAGEVYLAKTPIDLPLLLFFGIAIVSTLSSINQAGVTSITGFFGRFHGGLASLVSLVLLYYITVNTIKDRPAIMRVLWAFVLSGGLLALLGITNALGIPLLLGEEARGRTFTPIGSLTSLAIFLSLTTLVALGMLLNTVTGGNQEEEAVGSETSVLKRGRGRPRKGVTYETDETNLTHQSHEEVSALARVRNFFASFARPANFAQTIVLPRPTGILLVILLLSIGELAWINILAAWVTLGVGAVVMVFWNRPRVLALAYRYLGVCVALGIVSFGLIHVIGIGKKVSVFAPLSGEAALDPQSSWVIAAHTVRDYPILGSGPGTFFYNFTRYRAAAFNQSENWNIRFSVPYNEYFLYLATLGILGLFAAVTIGIRFIIFAVMTALKGAQVANHSLKVGVTAAALSLFFAQAFFAHTTSTAVAFMLLLALTMCLERLVSGRWVEDLKLSLALAPSGGAIPIEGGIVGGKREVMPSLFFFPGILIVFLAFYFVLRHLNGNLAYRASLTAAARNDGTSTYKLQLKAIAENPLIDTYRIGFAQTNLLLAGALVTKSNPSDQERQTATALVDQSIREARTATGLAPLSVTNWETLAQIYRNIAGSVPDAASWALQAYQQALNTDPPNPQLRLDVGGLLFAAQQYDAAIAQFQLATQLKPNLANTWYNLANAFQKKEMYHEALAAYGQAKPLVTPGSQEEKQLDVEIAQVTEVIRKAKERVKPEASPSPESSPAPQGDVAGEKTEASPLRLSEASPTPTPEPSPSPEPE